MNTITLHCSKCGKLISILEQDIGYDVQCPLCNEVFTATLDQTADGQPTHQAGAIERDVPDGSRPDPDAPEAQQQPIASDDQPADGRPDSTSGGAIGGRASFEPNFGEPAREDPEDIFSPAEAATEDIFGADPVPKVEMPAETGAENEQPIEPGDGEHVGVEAEVEPEQMVPDEGQGGVVSPTHAEAIRRTRAGGTVQLILLIFFIPYSIFATGVATWAILRMVTTRDPLERILERREAIKHDLPVPEELRVKLGETISRGMTEVQPLAVVRTDEGDLELRFRVKNLSEDHYFNPIPAEFASYNPQAPIPRLYIFLQRDTEESERVYGGQIRWYKTENGKKLRLVDGKLRPGEEMIVTLRTYPSQRGKVERLLRGETKLLWRLQLRRDWEKIAGRERFTCFVIGVEFDSSEIQAR